MAHISVLLDEILTHLTPCIHPDARVIDGTLGAGGHSHALLTAGFPQLLGLDLDPQALALAREKLAPFGERAQLHQASYLDMTAQAKLLGWTSVDAILLDLGVSSMQLDTASRGFAFMHDGDLDMRFNPLDDQKATAADIVNTWSQADLADLFWRYGEEKYSRPLAKTIIEHRPYSTTKQLAGVIENATPKKYVKGVKPIHPATRIFQALRIGVNDELRVLEETLPRAVALLKPKGRLAVISFHSLEDRIVKQVFKDMSEEIISPPGMVLQEKRAVVQLITRKPLVPSEQEQAQNPRSRSAKLRVVEKI
jgi:16S rRNA (cytosine1402-N4)-methyltransferase